MMPYESGGTPPASGHPLYPFASHYHVVSGYRMHYVDEGRGQPIIFLHGNPTWSFLYRDYIRALMEEYRIVAMDHIGCGQSDKPPRNRYPYTLARRIEDLDNLLAALTSNEKIALVVHDWGGPIGFGYAVRHPDRIKKLVVFNSAAFLWPPGKKFPWILRACRKSRIAGYLIRRLNAFALPASHLMCTKQEISATIRRGYLAPYNRPVNRVAIHRFIEDIPLEPDHVSYKAILDIQDRLHLLRDVPMAIFWGGRDFIFDREICAEWSNYFPDAEVHVFPEAGHNVVEDEKDAILPLLRGFLAKGSRA